MVSHASFAPVVSRQTRVLILGSLPGAASLAVQEYYAHPRNHFWMIMGAILGEDDFSTRSYAQRLRTLKKHHIGLWDVVAQAERKGSLDQNLKNIVANPLTELLGTLPHLKTIAFNGQTAARIGTRQLADTEWLSRTLVLPSTSPANTMMLAEKLERWRVVLAYL